MYIPTSAIATPQAAAPTPIQASFRTYRVLQPSTFFLYIDSGQHGRGGKAHMVVDGPGGLPSLLLPPVSASQRPAGRYDSMIARKTTETQRKRRCRLCQTHNLLVGTLVVLVEADGRVAGDCPVTFSLGQKRQPVCTPRSRCGFTTQALCPSIGFVRVEGPRPPMPHSSRHHSPKPGGRDTADPPSTGKIPHLLSRRRV